METRSVKIPVEDFITWLKLNSQAFSKRGSDEFTFTVKLNAQVIEIILTRFV